MEVPLASASKCELRSVIRFLSAKKVTPIEIHRQLVEVYGEKCMDIKNVRKWSREFNFGRTNVHDEERSGRPSVSDAIVQAVEAEMLKNRRATIRDLEEKLGGVCSSETIRHILVNNLQYHKVCARPHTANVTLDLLKKFGWEIIDHPPYSPDVAPSDYHMFPALKKHLGGKKFDSDAEVQKEVNTWLHEADGEWYSAGIDKFIVRMRKVLEKNGDYVEK